MWTRNGFLICLLLCTLSLACMAQTFQYSRGWTNGKRSSKLPTTAHAQRDEESLQNLQELEDALQDGERKLEKCLLLLERLLHSTLFLHSAGFPAHGAPLAVNFSPSAGGHSNNLFGSSHHQSNELYEELNSLEPNNEYVKH